MKIRFELETIEPFKHCEKFWDLDEDHQDRVLSVWEMYDANESVTIEIDTEQGIASIVRVPEATPTGATKGVDKDPLSW